MPPDRPAPGREQLVESALRLIAARGFAAATIRAVAEDAAVTPGLVVHHFGTKASLAEQVDALVLARFEAAMTVDPAARTPEDAARGLADRLSRTIGKDPDLRRYIRRAILEASPAGHAILERLVDLTIANLRQHLTTSELPPERELTWLAIQIVTINLAGTLLEPLLEPILGREPFTPTEVRRRSAANLDFISAALRHLST